MATTFTDAAWSKPGGELSAADYCKVCLIDYNPSGEEKVKAKCKLPIRKKPGGPVYRNALRNAMGRIFQMTGVPAAERRKAAQRLVRLAGQAGIEVGASVKRLAGRQS